MPLFSKTIPAKVAPAFRNATKNSDRQNTRIEHDRALSAVMTAIRQDEFRLFQQFSDNPDFKRRLQGQVLELASEQANAASPGGVQFKCGRDQRTGHVVTVLGA